MTETEPLLLGDEDQIDRTVRKAMGADRVAMDIESNGMFAYRARVCTLQLAWRDAAGRTELALIDTLAVDSRRLAPLLEATSPTKVVHDLAFDARLLAHEGVTLRGVRDTSIAAGYLGRRATGLRSLLASELGVQLDKELQLSDWGRRPLAIEAVRYLGADVEHLLALDDVLRAEVKERGIEDEVASETAYRLRGAQRPEPEIPPFRRVRGWDRLDPRTLALLRVLTQQRERLAERDDVPPFRIAKDEVLVYAARRRPESVSAFHALSPGKRSTDEVARALLAVIHPGLEVPPVPPEELPEDPRLDRQAIEARKHRERRLNGWREREAERRGVDPQVVLPGHCLREIAAREGVDAAAIEAIDGLGEARAARYGEALAELLQTVAETA